MLSLRSLLIFKTVAETGSFTQAAKKLYITQSAVSHTIKDLEVSTGLILFDRISKRIELTSDGKLLLQESIPLLTASRQLEARLSDPNKQTPFQIVSSITIAGFWLPSILQRLEKLQPDLSVQVNVVRAAEALNILRSGNAELAFVEGARPHPPFTYKHFAQCSLKVVCAPGYTNTSQPMCLSHFCNQRLLLREPGSAIRDTLDSELLLSGYHVIPAWQSVNSTALLEAAKAGLGIAVLPENLVHTELLSHTLEEVNIEGLTLKNDLMMVWHKDKHLTPAFHSLLNCI